MTTQNILFWTLIKNGYLISSRLDSSIGNLKPLVSSVGRTCRMHKNITFSTNFVFEYFLYIFIILLDVRETLQNIFSGASDQDYLNLSKNLIVHPTDFEKGLMLGQKGKNMFKHIKNNIL